MGVRLHFKTIIHYLKTTHLFYPHVTTKNCVRSTNNSQNQFGIMFGTILQTLYKSIQNKFSDNSNQSPNSKISTSKSS